MAKQSHDGDRVHPNLTLAMLSLAGLAYAVLSSAVISTPGGACARSLYTNPPGPTA